MAIVVCDTTRFDKAVRCLFYNAPVVQKWRQSGMATRPRFRLTYIRQWRQSKHMSLDQLADRVPMDKGNLSKIERGLLPYNQELLEKLADALSTDPASLIIRDPLMPGAIWSIWEKASPGEKRQIESVAQALMSAKQ